MYQRRRKGKKELELTNGPGKLTKSLGIVKEDYGRAMFEYPLFIAEGKETGSIAVGPRIGIHNSREADYFGMVSGKKEDKFAKTGLTPVKSDFVDAPYIREFPFNLECKIIQVIEIGLHTQFIGEVMDAKLDDTLQENGNQLIIEQIKPLIYATDSKNYYSIGKQIASAFSIGNEIGKEGIKKS